MRRSHKGVALTLTEMTEMTKLMREKKPTNGLVKSTRVNLERRLEQRLEMGSDYWIIWRLLLAAIVFSAPNLGQRKGRASGFLCISMCGDEQAIESAGST